MTSEQVSALRAKYYNATLVSVRKIQSDLAAFRIRPDFARPVHKPGQYCTIGLGYWEQRYPGCHEETLLPVNEQKLVRRAYSIGCPILDDGGRLLDIAATDWLEFYIVLVRESDKKDPPALTPRLFALAQGDRLFLGEKITGNYTLEGVRPTDAVVFLATSAPPGLEPVSAPACHAPAAEPIPLAPPWFRAPCSLLSSNPCL